MNMYLKWALCLPLHLLVIINRYWLAWVAVKFFSTENKLQLKPGWGWFMTIDNPLTGDAGWQTEHMPIKGDPLLDENRIGWLRRNGGNSLNYGFLGVPDDKWWRLGNHMIQDAKRLWVRPDGAWQYRASIPVFGRVWTPFIGWGLFGAVEGRCKFTCTILRFNKAA